MQISLGSSHAGMTQTLLQQSQITSSYLYYGWRGNVSASARNALSSIPDRPILNLN